MKQFNLLFIVFATVFATVLLFPVDRDITIIKSEITSNKPFAGTINNQVVGTEVCVAYWLDRDAQSDEVTIRVTRPYVLGALGYTYSTEIL
tara:strand:- start:17 stop:289 length:273 start_codon:yes stop_codon:yes gene_type:complete